MTGLEICVVGADEGEHLRLCVIDGDRDIAGLIIRCDGTAVLTTWPDGENNEQSSLPTQQVRPT